MPSRQNGKKVAVLPMRAEMLRLLYVGKELPENDSIVNMFCGKNHTLHIIASRRLVRIFQTKVGEVNVDLQGVIQYAFSESVDHFNAVHHVATLAAERKIREQRAVTSPNLSYAVTSPNLNDSHHESFQTLDSVPSRTTASSSSTARRYLPNANTDFSRFKNSLSLIPRPLTSHMMIFQTSRYAGLGLNLEVANAIVLNYAEQAENILLRQELAILTAEQADRKIRVKQAGKEAKAREKREAKDAKTARRGNRNASTVNVTNSGDATARADMYSNMFASNPVARRLSERGTQQRYADTADMIVAPPYVGLGY